MHPGRMVAAIGLAGAVLWATPARARGHDVGIFTYGSPGTAVAGAARGLEEAVADTGGAHLRRLGARRRRWAAARARRCHLRAGCLRRLARRLHRDVLVAEVHARRDGVALRLRLARGRRAGRIVRATLAPADVEAGTYGAAYRALGGRGRGTVTVGSHGQRGLVHLDAARVGPTPVVRHAVPAGAVRVTVTAEGYLPWHRLVAVRPGAAVVVRATLTPNPRAVPLAALVPLVPLVHAKKAAPAPKAAAPAPETAAPAPRVEPTPEPAPDVSPSAVARAAERADAGRHAPAARLSRARPGIGAGAWVTLGAGVAALTAGAFFGVSAAGNAATAQDPTTAQVLVPTLNARMARQATTANVLLAAGTAVASLGTWWLVHDLTAPPPTDP